MSSSSRFPLKRALVYASSVSVLVGFQGVLLTSGLVWAVAYWIYLPNVIAYMLLAMVFAVGLILTSLLFVRTVRVERALFEGGDPLSVPWDPFDGTRMPHWWPFPSPRNEAPLNDPDCDRSMPIKRVPADAVNRD